MTRQQIKQWYIDHLGIASRLVYNLDSGYKIAYENGDSYEYKIIKWTVREKITQAFINGSLVYEYVQH